MHGVATKDAPASFAETLRHLDAFATVSELERRARNPGWAVERSMFLPALKKGWELLVRALDPRQEKLPRKFPVQASSFPAAELDRVLSYDTFLRYVSRLTQPAWPRQHQYGEPRRDVYVCARLTQTSCMPT